MSRPEVLHFGRDDVLRVLSDAGKPLWCGEISAALGYDDWRGWEKARTIGNKLVAEGLCTRDIIRTDKTRRVVFALVPGVRFESDPAFEKPSSLEGAHQRGGEEIAERIVFDWIRNPRTPVGIKMLLSVSVVRPLIAELGRAIDAAKGSELGPNCSDLTTRHAEGGDHG